MKLKTKIFILFTVSLYINIGFGQILTNLDRETNQIIIGVQDSIYSETLGENRYVWVHVPRSKTYGHKYPVVYLLDGEYHFEPSLGILRASIVNSLMPEVIIVAITNTNRYRDFSTSHIGDENDPSGGANNFTIFIENELIPYIESKYPTVPHRTIIGHSLGGLFAIDLLINHNHIFTNYLAIDPSLSWDDQKLLKETKSKIDDITFENNSIYIAIANTINTSKKNGSNLSFENALRDTTTDTKHLRSIVEFAELIETKDQLTCSWKYYPSETHSSIPVIALHESNATFFPWFEFKKWDEFYKLEPELSGEELVALITSHYELISTKIGQTYLPVQSLINRLGYMFLDRKDFARALPFFKLNIKNYPESSNAHDSLGDYYVAVADKVNALKSFTKSIELGETPGTKEKVEKLRKEE